jgi:hypothetical protein
MCRLGPELHMEAQARRRAHALSVVVMSCSLAVQSCPQPVLHPGHMCKNACARSNQTSSGNAHTKSGARLRLPKCPHMHVHMQQHDLHSWTLWNAAGEERKW